MYLLCPRQLFSTRFVKLMIRYDYHAFKIYHQQMISKDGHLIFFNREYVNNKLCKLDRGTIDSFDSYKCVHIFIFISNFHSIITRMGLYHAITPSCVAYIKRYTVKVVVMYAFSGVQQYVWVLNTWMHDLPHLSFDSLAPFTVMYHFKKSLSFLNIFHI